MSVISRRLRCEAREGLATAVVSMREDGDYARFLDDVKSEIEAIDDFSRAIGTPHRQATRPARSGGIHRPERSHERQRSQSLCRGAEAASAAFASDFTSQCARFLEAPATSGSAGSGAPPVCIEPQRHCRGDFPAKHRPASRQCEDPGPGFFWCASPSSAALPRSWPI